MKNSYDIGACDLSPTSTALGYSFITGKSRHFVLFKAPGLTFLQKRLEEVKTFLSCTRWNRREEHKGVGRGNGTTY